VWSWNSGFKLELCNPTGFEIRESKPFWIREVYGTLELFAKNIAKNIQSHWSLLKSGRKKLRNCQWRRFVKDEV
jgi:hypothetical protein